MSPETKKKLLYGGGAIASIAALVLFMKKGQTQMPISAAGTGGMSGSGGPSSGSSANNSAALNAAVALAVEQSRVQAGLNLAGLQASSAIEVARINATAQTDAQKAKTMQAALGPGGAATAAAPYAAKAAGEATAGLFDIVRRFLFGPNDEEKLTEKIKQGEDPFSVYSVGLGRDFGENFMPYDPNPIPNDSFGNNGATSLYDSSGVPYYLSAEPTDFSGANYADYYQGSTGAGDSSWFGGASGNDGGSGGVPYYLAAAEPVDYSTVNYTGYEE